MWAATALEGLNRLGSSRCTFAAKVEALLDDAPELHAAIAPLLEARNVMRKQKVVLDRRLLKWRAATKSASAL